VACDVEKLRRAVPPQVRRVCEKLVHAGFEAYVVGGAVRDALLGREPPEWDVATDAHPEEVTALFRRTIPTGIQHGTVTVLEGRGEERLPIEVTTFRGEGAYSDARRPDHVVFGVPLEEDLARRDFVVNAIAYDPIARVVRDPFDGRTDLERRVLRAVGDAAERFREDGLRVLRAVRFVSTLEFDLDPETEEAIPRALESLAKVSMERVRVELFKLLESRQPERGLEIAWRRGILAVVLPELAEVPPEPALARVRAAPADPPLRLGALVLGVDAGDVDREMRRLTLSN
jgi:tRNA nucleotidyltransferase (CCA-adding enzyme)